jgi:hypothetical protein
LPDAKRGRWFVRNYRDKLEAAGAYVKASGSRSSIVHPERFNAVVAEVFAGAAVAVALQAKAAEEARAEAE